MSVDFEKNGKIITIINTHIYESLELEKLKIKLSQAKVICQKAFEHNPTIVAGDFNMEPETVVASLNGFSLENTMHHTYSIENEYALKMFNQIANKNGVHYHKPDYIFAHIKGAEVKSEVIKNPLVSDHYPLFATITVPEL
jgi:endonuclease/exonuclease/phosphatase family metal-dependent hydrolase